MWGFGLGEGDRDLVSIVGNMTYDCYKWNFLVVYLHMSDNRSFTAIKRTRITIALYNFSLPSFFLSVFLSFFPSSVSLVPSKKEMGYFDTHTHKHTQTINLLALELFFLIEHIFTQNENNTGTKYIRIMKQTAI